MIKQERNEAIVKAYREGKTLDELAQEHGITKARVHQILIAQNQPRRHRAHGGWTYDEIAGK